MERIQYASDGYEGFMPASAPLANAYVPFQREHPPKYEAQKGLVRGTLFPGLDLPFMGMVNPENRQVPPQQELQALMFAIQELALYLDTHKNDQEAFDLYRSYQKMYDACAAEYSKTHGPSNHIAVSEGNSYAWLNDPWPWEYCKNKEA